PAFRRATTSRSPTSGWTCCGLPPHKSHCPYKGTASYWSLDTGPAIHKDFVWIYRYPLAESQKIAGLACFYNEKVDLYVDGVLQARPRTKFSCQKQADAKPAAWRTVTVSWRWVAASPAPFGLPRRSARKISTCGGTARVATEDSDRPTKREDDGHSDSA